MTALIIRRPTLWVRFFHIGAGLVLILSLTHILSPDSIIPVMGETEQPSKPWGFALGASGAFLVLYWLVFARKTVIDGNGIRVYRGPRVTSAAPLADWKRVRAWEVEGSRNNSGVDPNQVETDPIFRITIDIPQGFIDVPPFRDGALVGNFRNFLDAHFVSLSAEGTRIQKLDGLQIDPLSGPLDPPFMDLVLALKPEPERSVLPG